MHNYALIGRIVRSVYNDLLLCLCAYKSLACLTLRQSVRITSCNFSARLTMNKPLSLLLIFFFPLVVLAQSERKAPSPYHTSWKDGLITGAFIGTSYWGLTIMQDKEGLSDEELARIAADPEAAKEDVPRIDRWAAGKYNKNFNSFSDIPFYGSFGLPLLYLAQKDTRQNFGQIALLYVETMAVTGTLYAQTVGRVNRNRPLVYNTDPDNEDRFDDKNQNSFFGGHVAATASATFFTAKVFNDFFPDSKAKPYVWAGAALIPAVVSYARLEAGKHYLTDNLLGYGIGATVGILVPHLHKKSKQGDRLSVTPVGGFGYEGFALRYKF